MYRMPISSAEPLRLERRLHDLVAIVMVLSTAVSLVARTDQLFGPRAVEYQPYQNSIHKLTIDYPKKDWQPVPGASAVIVTFAQKRSEANVVVEYEVLEQPLESKDIQQ